MARPTALPDSDIQTRVNEMEGWSVQNGKLHRLFSFGDFTEAFAFMTRIAIHAEKMDHHPEWANVYNRVEIDLTTHDAGGITELDFALAKLMNEVSKLS